MTEQSWYYQLSGNPQAVALRRDPLYDLCAWHDCEKGLAARADAFGQGTIVYSRHERPDGGTWLICVDSTGTGRYQALCVAIRHCPYCGLYLGDFNDDAWNAEALRVAPGAFVVPAC